jgi:hypothetical protein
MTSWGTGTYCTFREMSYGVNISEAFGPQKVQAGKVAAGFEGDWDHWIKMG